jgi:mono/diheme cytochrome c family protein
MRLLLWALAVLFAAIGATWCSSLADPAAPHDPDTLVVRSRAILHRHCSECHGHPRPPGDALQVLALSKLDVERHIVAPSQPESSTLYHLVRDGSKPPGTRDKVSEKELELLHDWIARGAKTDFPADLGDGYVRSCILQDLDKLPTGVRPQDVRYLSLTHLLHDPEAAAMLKPHQDALGLLQRFFAPGKPDALVPVDLTGTVYRMNLRDFGWDKKPFKKIIAGKPPVDSPVNLFDLVLLEYPYATIPEDSETFDQLAREFLDKAGQVRPVTHVRADWLVWMLTPRQVEPWPLAEDIPKALGKEAPLEAETLPGLKPFPMYAEGGVPVEPLDGLTFPAYQAPTAAVELLEFAIIDKLTRKPRGTFVAGKPDENAFYIVVRAKQPIHFQLTFTGSKGRTFLLRATEEPERLYWVPPGARTDEPAKDAIPIKGGAGVEWITLLANDGATPLPTGDLLRAEELGLRDRFVHPFYRLSPNGRLERPGEVGRILKRTLTLTTVEKE